MVFSSVLLGLLACTSFLQGCRAQESPGNDAVGCDQAKLLQVQNLAAQIQSLVSSMSATTCSQGMAVVPTPAGYPYPVIYPTPGSALNKPYLCDVNTENGGWIVIQLRKDGNVDFYRNWAEYKTGFGVLNGDFWLGLDAIHKLTKSGNYELRVDLEYQGDSFFAKYASFSIASEADNYRLSVDSYSGTAGDSLKVNSNGSQFSTRDRDNDNWGGDCANTQDGAWWYNMCSFSNLNGIWGSNESIGRGVIWETLTSRNSVSYTEMKIRKRDVTPM